MHGPRHVDNTSLQVTPEWRPVEWLMKRVRVAFVDNLTGWHMTWEGGQCQRGACSELPPWH